MSSHLLPDVARALARPTMTPGDPLGRSGGWGETGREHVRREAMTLRLLATSSPPVARLVATDPDGTEAEEFRAAYVAQGGRLDPDPAHILPGVTGSRPDLTADGVRLVLEKLLAHTLP